MKMRKIINLPAVVDPSLTSIWIVPTTNEVELLDYNCYSQESSQVKGEGNTPFLALTRMCF